MEEQQTYTTDANNSWDRVVLIITVFTDIIIFQCGSISHLNTK